ncbi:MAG: universal stress protein [Parasphingopyxis sp.]|uniref:universal stress protein n=1 Tax=Parasphingopyxis sp. TaxID=1920299 RepID=UPI003FA06CDA
MPPTLLFATDLTARGDRPLDRAVSLADEMHCDVKLLHVIDKKAAALNADPSDISEKIRADLPEQAAGMDIIVEKGSPPQTIARVAEETSADLIVTGVARHTSLGDITLGTAVDYIVRRAPVPVLVVKKRPLHPYKTLVAATDFSAYSLGAVNAAAALFPEAEIHLVHAYAVPYSGWLKSDEVEKEVREEAEEYMEKFLADPGFSEEVRARLHPHIGYGHIEEVIYRALREHDADLLVLGTHGRSGFAQATIGSNAQSMLTGAPSDVLMVRKQK